MSQQEDRKTVQDNRIRRVLREQDEYLQNRMNQKVWGFDLHIDLLASADLTVENKTYPQSVIDRVIELTKVVQDSEHDPDTRYVVEPWPSKHMRLITTVDKIQSTILLCADYDLAPGYIRPIFQ